jgi:predicted MFS family arabinose efflux permease
MQSPAGPSMRGIVTLVGALAAIYLVSQFLRNSVGVIAPDLAREIGLNAAEIGLLSSAFFLAFAAAQIPLGIALDRYGPKRCMLVCAAIAFAGTLVFALATTAAGLVFSRILMGLGSSCYLMAPLALYARRFPPRRFTSLAGIQMGIGSIGTLLVTAPLAWASAEFGWRMTFLFVAALVVVCGLLVAIAVKEAPAVDLHASSESLRESLAGVAQVVRLEGFWPIFWMQFVGYSSYAIIVGLWGGPYLAHVYGYSLTTRGELLMLPAIGQIVGVVLWGQADRISGNHKAFVLTGALATAAALALLAALGKPDPSILVAWLAVFGLLPAFLPVLIAHGRSVLAPNLLGRGMTLFNIGSMGGVFVVQLVSGALIDLFPAPAGAYPVEAYQLVFGAQAAAIVGASLLYLRAAR